jgi:hypothetical protein
MSSTYIGFDFDDCIAQCYSIMPVILFLEVMLEEEIKNLAEPMPPLMLKTVASFKEKFYENLAENEVQMKGTIIRPSILKILPELLKQRFEKKIEQLFIYSNNQDINLINLIDHVMALTLTKLPIPVPEAHLIKDANTGRLQTFLPRVHKMAPCRSSEKLIGFSYKEKTFSGVQTCLRKSIKESELWYLDDTLDHTDLINKLGLGKGYIQTSRYNIKMRNSKIAEIIVNSFPKEFFDINSLLGSIFLRAYSKLENIFIKNSPISFKFNPGPTDTEKKLIENLTKSLNRISPKVNNRSKEKLTEKEVDEDIKMIRSGLKLNEMPANYLTPPPNIISTSSAYGQPLQGGRYRRRVTRKMRRKVREAK